MNTEFDPLEAELRSLRPRVPSPELRQRIAAELVQPPMKRGLGYSRPGYFVVAFAALAASILGIAVFIRPDAQPEIGPVPSFAESPATAAFDAALPSVWQFRQSLNQSQADLETLLDQHAAARPSAAAPAVSLVQIRGFGRSDPNLENLLGEL